MQRSTRDRDEVRGWLSSRLDREVTGVEGTGDAGMSSETLLFEAGADRLVARLAPQEGDLPVFPTYDLEGQAAVMRRVRDETDVPVPEIVLADREVLVMRRVDGRVPPDVLPYTFGDNWLFDAPADEQRSLQDASVRLLAGVHSLAAEGGLEAHVAKTERWYDFVGERSSVVDAGFDWLRARMPEEGASVLSWGDARIGNVLYDGFSPVAVLDWEMAGAGPRELDVAWMVMAHMVFEHLAASMELAGMPSFMRADDVVETYEKASAVRLGDLGWYLVYAAVQWGIVFIRTGQRRVHFGEADAPASTDDHLYHRGLLEGLLS